MTSEWMVGETHTGVYYLEREVVEFDWMTTKVLAENDDYISLLRPGRSVYEPLVGSVYHPARLFFGKVIKKEQRPNEAVMMIKILMLLEGPMRK